MQCDHVCAECGAHEQGNWHDEHAKKLQTRGLCYSCEYWHVHIADASAGNVVRVDGRHYRIGEEVNRGGFRGFDGQRFKIKFTDGREVVTTNLWCQGAIPHRYRDRLPDNAQFEST
jgi:hypothetical protein